MSSGLALEMQRVHGGKWKQYPAYKDSGVEWLGVVPEGWEILQLRRVIAKFVDYRGATPTKVPSGTPLITAKNIKNGAIDLELSQEFIREGDYDEWMVRGLPEIGDVLVTTEAPLGESAQIEDNRIALAQRIILLKRDKSRIINDYLKYHFLSQSGKGELWSRATGSTAIGIKASRLKETLVTVPPIIEQISITHYLDRETAKIDALAAKKKRLVELLKEKRTALISHAVTKGLDPDAPMKDSGVEWLGEIPVGWAAGKTKYVATLRTGHTPSRQHPEYWRDCTIPWFSLADVWQLRDGRREYLGETKEKISTLGLANSSAELLPANTVIVSRTASVGFSGVMPEPMATTQDFVNWVCSPKIQPEYLLYVFRSMEHEFKRLTMGSTHKTIYMPDAASFQTPVPPPGEQKQIVKYVQKHKRSLEHVEDLVAVSIEKLREYRTALISAAVTGKIDVREELVS